MNHNEPTLHSIGDVAQRTGLSVSAIRYYSDEGLVTPTELTDGGHRLYDIDAIARLEFIRTLRDLETDLTHVRRVLTGATSLRDILAEHLETVEKRTDKLLTKRAVLRALVRAESTAERAQLLQKLVTMPDADRERLIDDFWSDVSAGLPSAALTRLDGVRPLLTADPTPAQLDAWVTLAELLGDEQFRHATREYLHDTYTHGAGEEMSAPGVQEHIESTGADLTQKLGAAHAAGLSADDAHVLELATQFVEQTAQAVGASVNDELRMRLADRYRTISTLALETVNDTGYRATEGLYLELVAIINDEQNDDTALSDAARGSSAEAHGLDLRAFGPWLADAISATLPRLTPKSSQTAQ